MINLRDPLALQVALEILGKARVAAAPFPGLVR
jgi:hypothetical protein